MLKETGTNIVKTGEQKDKELSNETKDYWKMYCSVLGKSCLHICSGRKNAKIFLKIFKSWSLVVFITKRQID